MILRHWDWDGMVEANRGWLLRLLTGLFMRLGSEETVRRVDWRRMVAALVRLEASLRRLICVMARDLPVVVVPARAFSGRIPKGKGGERDAVFRLTDPPRNPDAKKRSGEKKPDPRVRWLDEEMPPSPETPDPSDEDVLDASALRRRMEAMMAALADLPKQAQRLARWYARNERMRRGGTWRRVSPLRSGRPPGHREGGTGEVDDVLGTCHDLAVRCFAMLDEERYGR